MSLLASRGALGAISSLCLQFASYAQCEHTWESLSQVPGIDGPVYATSMWDPDGSGPLSPVLVLGGDFGAGGNVVSNDVLTYDPATGAFGALPGLGPTSVVNSVVVLPNGDLVVAGTLGDAAGSSIGAMARWTGSNWIGFGGMANGPVLALLVEPGGSIVAVGGFTTLAGAPAQRVARWDGSAWSAFGSGITGSSVAAVARLPNGDIYVGGSFTHAGGVPAASLARWNGTSWSPLGSGVQGEVYALHPLANGEIAVGGVFTVQSAGGSNLARWNGSSLVPIVMPAPYSVRAIMEMPNGDLWVAGGGEKLVRRLVGTQWIDVATFPSSLVGQQVRTLVRLPSGDVVAGGLIQWEFPVMIGVARWSSNAWHPLANGLPLQVITLAELPSGDLVAGLAEIAANPFLPTLWRRVGGTWYPFGNFVDSINALAVLPNGDLAIGSHSGQGMVWNGSSFATLGGVVGSIFDFALTPNGDLLASGIVSVPGTLPMQGVLRWNGQSWSSVGSLAADVIAIACSPAGTIYAASSTQAWQWTGSAWWPLAFPSTAIYDLTITSNGSLVMAGAFSQAGGVNANSIARWNGTIWQPLGSGVFGSVVEMCPLPDGGLLVAGSFSTAGGQPAASVARWNGSGWSAEGAGVDLIARSLVPTRNGDVLVGGSFRRANGVPAYGIARIGTPCPATVQVTGAGCVGGGGLNELTAQSLPWIGSTFRSVASGMTSNAFGVVAAGVSTANVPLSLLLPQGMPGCVLQVAPDLLWAVAASGGSAPIALPLPNETSLVGLQLHQQVASFTLDAVGTVLAVTVTNSLSLNLGAF